MTPPEWMNAVIRDFGRSAGIGSLALNERGAAALRFETGQELRLEYTGEELVVAMAVPSGATEADLKVALERLLSYSHPRARLGFRLRTGYLRKSASLFAAVRLAVRDVTLPKVNAVFSALWRIAGEIGGAAWA